MKLSVNVDHVATIRQARGTRYPDPVHAALQAEKAGADSITLHLREDRRHIQERDVLLLKDTLLTHMNLEMAVTEEMLALAERIKPSDCCLVPEKREDLYGDAVDLLGAAGPDYLPGEDFIYSNLNSETLGAVIEAVTGVSLGR